MSLKGSKIQKFQNMACDPYFENKFNGESDANTFRVTRVIYGSQKVKSRMFLYMTCDIYFGREFNGESNVNIFRVTRKGQYNKTRLARRASKSDQNWPEGPVQQSL